MKEKENSAAITGQEGDRESSSKHLGVALDTQFSDLLGQQLVGFLVDGPQHNSWFAHLGSASVKSPTQARKEEGREWEGRGHTIPHLDARFFDTQHGLIHQSLLLC